MSKCPKCGKELKRIKQNSGVAYCCVNCDYSVATTDLDPIFEDQQEYTIRILPNNSLDKETLKVLSSIAKLNYIDCKQLIEKAPSIIFKGDAVDVKDIKSKLDNSNIAYSIEPVFIY